MDYFPPIDERLVAVLAETFPDQSPTLDMTEKEVWFAAGNAHVIKWLKLKLDEQIKQNRGSL